MPSENQTNVPAVHRRTNAAESPTRKDDPARKVLQEAEEGTPAKRYPGDDDEFPQYGFKLHKRHWKYADRQHGPLSANLCSCIHTGVCSIALHPGGKDYYHIAVIDLDTLNHCGFLSSPLLAQYQPIQQPPNNCHFEIMPEDGTVLAWMEVSAFLDRPFPPAKKLPVTDEDQMKAAEEYAKYRSCFDIRRWVRKQDGTLE